MASPVQPQKPPAADFPPAEDKRERILRAAREVCARAGYEASTMDAVAAEARVSKGTLYNFFESKEHLFRSTVLEAYDRAEARVQARMARLADPRRRLEALVDALVEGFPEVASGMLVNLQIWAVVAASAEEREQMFADLRARYARLDEDTAATVRAGQEVDAFRSETSAEEFARMLSSTYDGFVYRSVFDADGTDPARLRACLERLVHEHVLRSDAPGTRKEEERP